MFSMEFLCYFMMSKKGRIFFFEDICAFRHISRVNLFSEFSNHESLDNRFLSYPGVPLETSKNTPDSVL